MGQSVRLGGDYVLQERGSCSESVLGAGTFGTREDSIFFLEETRRTDVPLKPDSTWAACQTLSIALL